MRQHRLRDVFRADNVLFLSLSLRSIPQGDKLLQQRGKLTHFFDGKLGFDLAIGFFYLGLGAFIKRRTRRRQRNVELALVI